VTDRELSVRAGLNVGIEPTLLPFLQAGAGNLIEVKPTGDTVIAENTGQAARVALTCATNLGGYLFNTSSDVRVIDFFFIDEVGNEISLTGATPISVGGSPAPILLADMLNFFCLAPGEKIIARRTADTPQTIFGAALLSWLRADDNPAGGASWPNRIAGAPAFTLAGGAPTPATLGGQQALSFGATTVYSAAITLTPGAFPGMIIVLQYIDPLTTFSNALASWGDALSQEAEGISAFAFGPVPDLTLYAQQFYNAGLDGQFALNPVNSINPPTHPMLQGVLWNSPQELYLQGDVFPVSGGTGVLPIGNSQPWTLVELGSGFGLPGLANVRYAELILFDMGPGGLTSAQRAQLRGYFAGRYGAGVITSP
jgi:hypothetical protein